MIEELNLSVDCQKIIEWLFERKKIPKDWPKKHKALQLKMTKICEKDLPNQKAISEYIISNKENFSFFHLNEVIQKLLLTSEANEKNFFGSYSSASIKEWIAMKEFFQKDGLHIVDIARIISQNVTFEIPGLKKNILLLEGQYKDNLNKVLDLKTTIKTSERDFITDCEKINIKGENLEKEVVELILILPEIFKEFTHKLKQPKMKEILQYYYEFILYINSKQDKEKMILRLVEYIYEENDDTLSYYHNKKENVCIDKDLHEFNEKRYEHYSDLVKSIENHQASNKPVVDEIDWNFKMEQEMSQDQEHVVPSNNDEIIWDFTIDNPVDIKQDVVNIDVVDNSDFHILENNKKIEQTNEEWEIIDVKNIQNAKNYANETLLSNRETRNEIIANLYELFFFLKQRNFETKSFSTNSLLQAYDHTTTGSLFEITVEKLEIYHNLVLELINLITNYKIRNLFIIKEQPKARERMVNHLKQYLLNIEKNKKNIDVYEKKMEELQSMLEISKAKMKRTIEETFELKIFCEKLLKELIKKEISIVGDINKLNKL